MADALLATLAAARAAGDPAPLLAALPYARFLGIDARAEGDGLVLTMQAAPHLVGNPSLPALHGGTLGALLEIAAIAAVAWRDGAVVPRTISLTIDYLRSAPPTATHAEATLVRVGRRVATVAAVAWQGARAEPVAQATIKLLVAPRSTPAARGDD
ncbi:MAG: PaaI family thioesterase [Kofleriaceae bacterium]